MTTNLNFYFQLFINALKEAGENINKGLGILTRRFI